MGKFICTSESKSQTDYLGNFVGMMEKRVLCYSPRIGKHKVYRTGIEKIIDPFEVLEFSDIEEAEKLCSEINKANNDDFKVEEVQNSEAEKTPPKLCPNSNVCENGCAGLCANN